MIIRGQNVSVIGVKEINDYKKIKKRFYHRAVVMLNYISAFCRKACGRNIPTKNEISRFVLVKENTSERRFVTCYAYLLAEYVDNFILKTMNKRNYYRFKQKIDYITIVFEELAYFIEKDIYAITQAPLYKTSGFGRTALTQFDILMAANSLMYIETVEDIKDMWNADLVPGSLMYLRLYIDNKIKELIPYKSILDSSGKEVQKTGLRREFIKKQVNTCSSNVTNIEDARLLVNAYEWCCDAVHYGALIDHSVGDWTYTNIKKINQVFIDTDEMKKDFNAYVLKEKKCSVTW